MKSYVTGDVCTVVFFDKNLLFFDIFVLQFDIMCDMLLLSYKSAWRVFVCGASLDHLF